MYNSMNIVRAGCNATLFSRMGPILDPLLLASFQSNFSLNLTIKEVRGWANWFTNIFWKGLQLQIVLVRFCSGLCVAIAGGLFISLLIFLGNSMLQINFSKRMQLQIVLVRFCSRCMNHFGKECRFAFSLLRS